MALLHYKKIGVVICMGLIMSVGALAQDWHFSQYFNVPTIVSPANTGFDPQYDYRVGGIFRSQWSNISNGYRTYGAWGDVQLLSNKIKTGWVGLGGSVFSDVAGSGGLTAVRGVVSVAYHQKLSESSLLSAGIGVGGTNKFVNLSKFRFDNQWNGLFFDTQLPNNENFKTNNISYLDVQLGVNYAYFINTQSYINIGVSVNDLNTPYQSFFAVQSATTRISPRYTAFINSLYKTYDGLWILNPNFYYSTIAGSNEFLIGMNANRNISNEGEHQLILGLYYRYNDAIIPMIGYQYQDFKLTVSYDATISELTPYNSTNGAYEISLIKQGIFSSGKYTKCPVIRF